MTRTLLNVLSGFTISIVVSLLSVATSHAFGAKPAHSIRILPLGDSLTAGGFITDGTYKNGAGYRFTLWKLLKDAGYSIEFEGLLQDGPREFPQRHHEGHAGYRIDQILANAYSWVSKAKPDVVLLLIGTNDAIQNYEFQDAVIRLSRLVDEIQSAAPQSEIIISTTIPNSHADVEGRIVSYNKELTTWIITKEKVDSHIHFADMYANSGIRSGLLGGPSDLIDGVHPTSDGYDGMARVWFQAIQALLHP